MICWKCLWAYWHYSVGIYRNVRKFEYLVISYRELEPIQRRYLYFWNQHRWIDHNKKIFCWAVESTEFPTIHMMKFLSICNILHIDPKSAFLETVYAVTWSSTSDDVITCFEICSHQLGSIRALSLSRSFVQLIPDNKQG